MSLVVTIVNLHGYIGRQRLVCHRIEWNTEDIETILNASMAKDEGRESSYKHSFEVKPKSNLTCQFIRIENTRIDEGVALNTLFIFNDDFNASR